MSLIWWIFYHDLISLSKLKLSCFDLLRFWKLNMSFFWLNLRQKLNKLSHKLSSSLRNFICASERESWVMQYKIFQWKWHQFWHFKSVFFFCSNSDKKKKFKSRRWSQFDRWIFFSSFFLLEIWKITRQD